MSEKTLSDYTPEEREGMVGMWCKTLDGFTYIFCEVITQPGTGRLWCRLTVPSKGGKQTAEPLEETTPRFDLPRAWSPDGTPPEGDWEGADYIDRANHGAYTLDEPQVQAGPKMPTGTTRARHWVSEWEPAPWLI